MKREIFPLTRKIGKYPLCPYYLGTNGIQKEVCAIYCGKHLEEKRGDDVLGECNREYSSTANTQVGMGL